VDTPAVPALLIGSLFVEKGLITQEQLDLALAEQQTTGERLGEILVERFGVSRLDLASTLAEQWAEYERHGTAEEQQTQTGARDLVVVSTDLVDADATPVEKRPIGEIFLERGMIDEDDLSQALEVQRATGRRLGEILVDKGNLTRLELAGALADQWASFQKLRPPVEENGIRPPADAARVMPTPEVTRPAQTVSADELTGLRDQIDALAAKIEQVERALADQPTSDEAPDDSRREELAEVVARIEELAAQITDGSQPPAELPVDLTPRLAELEQRLESLIADRDDAAEDVRASLAAVEQKLAALESGSGAWRQALDTLATELAERIGSVEAAQTTPTSDADVRGALKAELDALTARLDSLPEPNDDAVHARVSELASRLDEVAGQLPTGLEEIRDTLAALSTRVDELPTPSEEWRDQIEALGARLDGLASQAPALDELRAGLAELGRRIDALPAPSEEWREQIATLAARVGDVQESVTNRLDEFETDAGKRLSRGDAKQLSRRLDELSDSLPDARRQIDAALATLSARVAAISASSDEWREQLDTLATQQSETRDRLPGELQEVRDRLDTLSARIDAVPAPSEEWRAQIDALRSRFDEVIGFHSPVLEEVRVEVTALRERVDAIPPPSDEWRGELGQVADNLRVRLERVEAETSERAHHGELAEVRERVDEVASRLPGERQELEAAIAALSSRIDAIPTPTDEWREYVDGLRSRLDEIVGAQPTAVEELRTELATLGARIDSIPAPSEEWREGLAALEARVEAVPDDVQVRLDRIEDDVAARADHGALAELVARLDELDARIPDRLGELRSSLRQLADRVDAFPEPSDEWRTELANVAENLRTRVERVEAGLELRPGLDLVAGLREELQTLTARLESRLDESERRQDAHDERIAVFTGLSAHLEGIEPRLREELLGELHASLAARDARAEELGRRIEEAAHRLGTVDNAFERIAELERLLDEHSHRIEGLQSTGPSAAELAETIGARLDAADAAAADTAAALDDRLAGLDLRLTAATDRVGADVDSIRRELDDARGVTAAAAASAEVRIEQLGAALRAEIASLAGASDQREAIERLAALSAGHGESLDALQSELHQYEHRLEERLAGKAAELAAMRARFEQVEGSLAGINEGADAATATADARLAGLDASTAALDEKVAALEKSQAKRGDVRELRETMERIEHKVDAEVSTEDARVHAVEEALRDGLASLGSRLAETETTYVEAGNALRRSIERLGSAIRSADDAIAPPATDAPREIDLSSFLAFAPTPEGYRLVELPGPPPAVGETVDVPDFPPQVVARLGASPLPFDRRACAYLEPR